MSFKSDKQRKAVMSKYNDKEVLRNAHKYYDELENKEFSKYLEAEENNDKVGMQQHSQAYKLVHNEKKRIFHEII